MNLYVIIKGERSSVCFRPEKPSKTLIDIPRMWLVNWMVLLLIHVLCKNYAFLKHGNNHQNTSIRLMMIKARKMNGKKKRIREK